MKPTEREQARRIVANADEIVLHRRSTAGGADPLSAEDRELERLSELVRCLSDVKVVAPSGFQEELARRIRQSVDDEGPAPRGRAAFAGRPRLAGPTLLGKPPTALRTAMLTAAVLQRQFALEQLAGVADVLQRVPAFTSRLSLEPGAATHLPH